MSRNELRAQTTASRPAVVKDSGIPDGQTAEAPTASPHRAGGSSDVQTSARQQVSRAPWLIRNSRKVTIVLVLATLAGSPFAYVYLRRNFGPDPLAGIKLEGVKFDTLMDSLGEIKPVETKSAETTPAAATWAIAPAPRETVLRTTTTTARRPPADPARPHAAAPAAPATGITHTRPTVATAPAPAASTAAAVALPRASVRENPPDPGTCTEAVTALGLCNLNATGKGSK